MNSTVKRLAEEFDLTESQITRELIRWALCNRNWMQTGFPSLVTEKPESLNPVSASAVWDPYSNSGMRVPEDSDLRGGETDQ